MERVAGGQTGSGDGRYRVGTLRYTVAGLTVLFSWLLWGDFCFTIFESIFGRFLPLYMTDLHASNKLIGIMTGGMGGMLNILFLPGISIWSDRYRSRWGRRIPFLFWATPCAVVSLVLIAFAPEIGRWLFASIGGGRSRIAETTLILGTLCVVVASYHFFNMILVNIYQCLLRDVVPQELMARFLSLFRVVGTAGAFVFSWYLFPYVIAHRKLVCTGVGIVYAVSFMLMCAGVREGDYPPPPPASRRGNLVEIFTNYLAIMIRYFRECLSVNLYRNYLIMCAMVTAASTCASPYLVLFTIHTLGLSMDDAGKIFAWSSLASAILFIPAGYLCDKISPLRVVLMSLAGFVCASAFVFFAVHDQRAWFIYSVLIFSLPNVGWNLGLTATTMVLFPAEKFAQLSSSVSVVGYGSLVVGNLLAGEFMDLLASNYRMIFMWSLVWFAGAFVPMLLVYRGWKRRGGLYGYVPPIPSVSAA